MNTHASILLVASLATATACTNFGPVYAGVGLNAAVASASYGPEDADAASADSREVREENAWFAAGRATVAAATTLAPDPRRAKNVILFVGDGMGIATVTAARILEGQRAGRTGEENLLAFERLPYVAFSKTYSVDAQVADSASTMTAMVSGVKTLQGVLGVDERARRGDHRSVAASSVPTIVEEAEARGLATGIVTTTTLTHATPAGCYAHVPLRSWQDDSELTSDARRDGFPDIARQLIEFSEGDGLEVALGGGRQHFTSVETPDPEDPKAFGRRRDGRDLTAEWVARREGSVYVWNRAQLLGIDRDHTRHLLGLFDPGHMAFEADRASDAAGEPSLAEMTRLAIELLARDPDGYFLMVEGGRIDHGHHSGNAYRALTDAIAFSDAVRAALETTDRGDTLIVVTADHSHTLAIAGYPKRGNPILGKVVGLDRETGGETLVRDADGLPYTTLSYANGPGQVPGAKRPDLSEVDTTGADYRQEALVPMSSETHAGEDVPIYAGGPGAALFHGVREQNYIYHAMVEALGWTHDGVPTK